MRRLALFILLFASIMAVGQSTTVTGTVVDSDSTVWANGKVTIDFVPTPGAGAKFYWNGVLMTDAQKHYLAFLDSGGNFSIAIPDNNTITPAGSRWGFTVCPNATSNCTLVQFPVTGATFDASSVINAHIEAPRFDAGVDAYGYADVEIIAPHTSSFYFNVVSNCSRQYNGSAWQNWCGSATGIFLSAISVSPTSVSGGSNSTGTATLSASAPAGGAIVPLTSGNPSVASVPANVTVATGTTSSTFTITTTPVGSNTTVAISGTYGGSTHSANLVVNAPPQPIYGGVGIAGANSSVTVSGSTVILSTGDVLNTLQTTPETVGQSWSFSPNSQVIYLLLFGGSHTFVDANTGFPFVFNAPITTSVGGVTMYLYQSTNTLFGNYKPKVVS